GVEEVTIAYRRTRAEMPAWEEEIDAALEEGIKIEFLVAPQQVLVEDGKVKGLRCVRMELGEPDASGRRRPIPIPGSEVDLDVDTVIPAIGQVPILDALAGVEGVEFSRYGTIEADPVTYEAGRSGVFAGGDMMTGPFVAIGAVAAGNEAAKSIVRYLQGEDMKAGREPIDQDMDRNWRDIPTGEKRKPRLEMPKLSIEERLKGFDEVELGFDPELGISEAARCISCSDCCECYRCVNECQAEAVTRITHAMTSEDLEVEVGSVILAPGSKPFDPSLFNSYSYASHPNVITALELERLLSAGGPTIGHLVRTSDHKEPSNLAFLQCIGSRDINRCDHGYCSSVCCMYALKEAIIAKEHSGGDLDVTVFFMDMRTVGKDFERYYEKAKAAGIRFVRCRVHTVNPMPDSGNLSLRYVSEDGQVIDEEFEMVVLSHGLEITPETMDLAKRLDVDLDHYNFAQTSSFEPVATSRPGIYACGVMSGPKDIPQSVMEASAAAGAASARLVDVRNTQTRVKEIPPARDVAGEPPRVGVFVCDCGINIAGVVDVPAVAEYARTLPFVEFVAENLFTCSQDTQDKMAEVIESENLNRIVVAACTPRTHEALFQETMIDAGLNKYLFEMANIRNQNSWVHPNEPEAATEKAKDLVRMAVSKAALLVPLQETEINVEHSALVIGGGVAGMTAAKNLATQGFDVDLVEKSEELGGQANKLFQTAKGEDIAGFVQSLADEVKADDRITLHLGTTLDDVDGFVGNFKSTLSDGTEITHGVAIIATGASEYESQEYLYGQDPRVVNSLEMDEMFKGNDPALQKANSVVFVQCVGSREPDRPYCSKICCTHSVLSALEIKKRNPDASVYILYRDIRTFGEREDLYREARAKGVIFIRYELEKKPTASLNGEDLEVSLIDPILQREVVIKPDYLVLASAIVSNRDSELAQMFKIPLDDDGWLLEAHQKLRPVDFATDGVFMAGLAHYPKPIEESIAQAQAAASRATTILSALSLMVGGTVAEINQFRCTGCGVCVEVCPFNAIQLDENEKAVVNEALCKGCGTCVSSCRSGAPSLRGFTNADIFAQIAAS
ncbi:MAG: FAD-dependent oxidoreductase, partial [Deltaproteobacteria bacterium]|nr:FAD-dependent oxidoreductase [Deltaproteobacteria bacterium]